MSYADIFSDQDTSSDLGITLVGAALLHIVLILGLTFSLPKKQINDEPPQLEITLVQTHSQEQPDDAEFLANASQKGGGDTEKQLRAKTPLPGTGKKAQPQPMFRPESAASESQRSPADKILVAESSQQKPISQPREIEKKKNYHTVIYV